MEIKIFKDLIEALGKVAAGLKALVDIPRRERERYRQTMDETYRLIDTTLNMVIIRLGDILLMENDHDFLREVEKLDYYGEWMQAEREFRLCKSLRSTLRETQSLYDKLTGPISAEDWDTLLGWMHSVLATETEVGGYISQQFRELADTVRAGGPDPKLSPTIRNQVRTFREVLIKERQQLIQQEIELFSII